MVTKEDRRGIRFDLEELRKLVIKQKGGPLTKGTTGIIFGWGHSKLFSLFRMCSEAYDDIELRSGNLFFVGVERVDM